VEEVLLRYATNDAMILEQLMNGTVIGSLPGLPGNGRHISFRSLHAFELRNGRISRENVWRDSAAIVHQLSRR
jgi:predicted ester cyclase